MSLDKKPIEIVFDYSPPKTNPPSFLRTTILINISESVHKFEEFNVIYNPEGLINKLESSLKPRLDQYFRYHYFNIIKRVDIFPLIKEKIKSKFYYIRVKLGI
jgi:hypothetical protein